jgi:membrane fusion protein (multidrug efflux system)
MEECPLRTDRRKVEADPAARRFRASGVVFFAVPALALAMLLPGCGGGKSGADSAGKKPTQIVQTVKAERRDLVRTMTYVGSVEPVKVARMASPAEGPIVECSVREGDRVVRGQRLVRVGRNLTAESSLAAAREDLARQEADFKRVEQLVESGSLPGEQLEIARASLKRSEAQAAAAQTGANDFDIRAPWSGVVSRVWVSEGNYVAPRTSLVELFDPASLVFRFAVPERDMRFIHSGVAVRVKLDAYPGREFPAKIVRVYPEMDRKTGTVTVEAEPHTKERLASGLFARVETPIETLENAVVVPEGALVVLPGGDTAVFAVTNGKVVRRRAQVAMEAGGFVAVRGEIQPGEMVVSRGNETLKDGMPVQVMGQPKEGPGGVSPTRGTEKRTSEPARKDRRTP